MSARMGGRGERPGEFRGFDGVWMAPDGSIVVVNGFPPATIVHFGTDCSVVGQARLTGVMASPAPFVHPLGIVGAGQLLSSVEYLVLEDHREPFRAGLLRASRIGRGPSRYRRQASGSARNRSACSIPDCSRDGTTTVAVVCRSHSGRIHGRYLHSQVDHSTKCISWTRRGL